MPETAEPKVYLAGAVGILAQYPIAVIEKIADPISGSALIPNFPSLQALRQACDEIAAPMIRQETRADPKRKLIAYDKKLTEEERARRAAQVDDLKRRMAAALKPEPFEPSNATATTTTTTSESLGGGDAR